MSGRSVWKFYAPVADNLTLDMPKGAAILCVQVQGGDPHIWAMVDVDAPLERRRLQWRGTGHPADGVGVYVGTVQIFNGLVFHLFDSGAQ